MHKYRSLRCYNCRSVILNIPESELAKLDGLTFLCECCGHHNTLDNKMFVRGINEDPSVSFLNFDIIPFRNNQKYN